MGSPATGPARYRPAGVASAVRASPRGSSWRGAGPVQPQAAPPPDPVAPHLPGQGGGIPAGQIGHQQVRIEKDAANGADKAQVVFGVLIGAEAGIIAAKGREAIEAESGVVAVVDPLQGQVGGVAQLQPGVGRRQAPGQVPAAVAAAAVEDQRPEGAGALFPGQKGHLVARPIHRGRIASAPGGSGGRPGGAGAPALMRPPAAAPAPGRAGAQPRGKARHPQPGPRPQTPDPVHRPDHPVKRDQPGIGVAQAGDAPVGGEIPAPAGEGRPRLGRGHVGGGNPAPARRARQGRTPTSFSGASSARRDSEPVLGKAKKISRYRCETIIPPSGPVGPNSGLTAAIRQTGNPRRSGRRPGSPPQGGCGRHRSRSARRNPSAPGSAGPCCREGRNPTGPAGPRRG